MSINLYNHRGNWTISDKLKEQVVAIIEGAKGENLTSASVYFMKNSPTIYETANKKELKIFFSASPGEGTVIDTVFDTDKNTYAVKALVPVSTSYASAVFDEKKHIIGYYSAKHNELYVHYDIDELAVEAVEDIVSYILKQFKLTVLDEFINKDSWIKSKQKDALRQEIVEHLSKGREQRLAQLKGYVEDTENAIRRKTQQLKENFDQVMRYRSELEKEESSQVTGLDNFIKGLDQIAEHPQVSNVLVTKDIITIYIDKVYAYANVKGVEKRFYIGNMHVKININNTDVKFYGDNPRKSVWTSHDPHPHVNGNDGRACLGNVAATIAELCSQKEIYPLFLVCLDFLENANTEDSAGKNVTRWDEVDEDGNVIVAGHENRCTCDHCGDDYEEEEGYTVYTDFNDGGVEDAENWCEGCRDSYATYSDHVEEIISDEIYNDVENYFNDEDEDEDGEDLF